MSSSVVAALRGALVVSVGGALALAGCGRGAYRVEVTLPSGVSAERVEVRVLPACGSNDVLERSVVTRGVAAMELGTLAPGSYGIEALVFDASCQVVAEGCVMVTASGGAATVRVTTAAVGPRDCRPAEDCMCTPVRPDAGMIDAPCTDCDGDGMCENLMTDRDHCGRCDSQCSPPMRCTGGTCG